MLSVLPLPSLPPSLGATVFEGLVCVCGGDLLLPISPFFLWRSLAFMSSSVTLFILLEFLWRALSRQAARSKVTSTFLGAGYTRSPWEVNRDESVESVSAFWCDFLGVWSARRGGYRMKDGANVNHLFCGVRRLLVSLCPIKPGWFGASLVTMCCRSFLRCGIVLGSARPLKQLIRCKESRQVPSVSRPRRLTYEACRCWCPLSCLTFCGLRPRQQGELWVLWAGLTWLPLGWSCGLCNGLLRGLDGPHGVCYKRVIFSNLLL